MNSSVTIPKNAIKIDVEIETSNSFQSSWYRARKCIESPLSVDELQFLNLSHKLNKECSTETVKYYRPLEGELVSVYVDDSSRWMRGFVISIRILNQSKHVDVHLIDYGYDYTVILGHNFLPLPDWFSTSVVESRSFKVSLYGVAPISKFITFSAVPEGEKRVIDDWHPKSVHFIKQCLLNAKNIYFLSHYQHEEVKFGYFYLENENGAVSSLNTTLIKVGYAIEFEDWTERLIMFMSKLRKMKQFDAESSVRKRLYPSLNILLSKETSSTRNSERRPYTAKGSYKSRSSTTSTSSLHESLEDVPSSREDTYSDHYYSTTSSVTAGNFSFATSSPIVSDISQVHFDIPSNNSASKNSKNNSIILENSVGVETLVSDIVKDKIVILSKHKNSFNPVPDLHKSPLDINTLRKLDQLAIRDLMPCQKFIIPAMMTKNDLIIVDGCGTGKISGCLFSIVSLLKTSKPYSKPGISPRCVIISPYSTKCEDIHGLCFDVINGRKKSRIKSESGGLNVNFAYGCGKDLESEKLVELTEGFDILICTPKMLSRLLEKSTFNLSRLEIIVFDDYHDLSERYSSEIHQIRNYVLEMKRPHVQQVFISNYWMPRLTDILNFGLQNGRMNLLLSSSFEAAKFICCKWLIYITLEDALEQHVINTVKSNTSNKTVVVVFSDESKMADLYIELTKLDRPIYKIRSTTCYDKEKCEQFKGDITLRRYPVLLCTDLVLGYYNIYGADILIHHSLPDKSKTAFKSRFSALLDRLQYVAEEMVPSFEDDQNRVNKLEKPLTIIYLNENDRTKFNHIIEESRVTISDNMKLFKKNIQYKYEALKQTDFCLNMKEMGICRNGKYCKQRHMLFRERDAPDLSLPQSGIVELLITHVYSPVHFRVRLLKHLENGNCELIKVPEITLKMKSYFSKNKPEVFLCKNVGDLAATDISEPNSSSSDFVRVRIMEFVNFVLRKDPTGLEFKEPIAARLKLIDSGEEIVKPLASLVALSDELASIPETTIDIFLCNVLPIDGDITWGRIITENVRREIDRVSNIDSIKFRGQIELVIGRSIWLSSLNTFVYKEILKRDILHSFSVLKYLLRNKLVIKNEQHLTNLRDLRKYTGPVAVSEIITDLKSNSGEIEIVFDRQSETNSKFESNSTAETNCIGESGRIAKPPSLAPSDLNYNYKQSEEDLYTHQDSMGSKDEIRSAWMQKILGKKITEPKPIENPQEPLNNEDITFSASLPCPQSNSVSDKPENSNFFLHATRLASNGINDSAKQAQIYSDVPQSLEDRGPSMQDEWCKRPVPSGKSVLIPSVSWRQDLDNIYVTFNVNCDDYEFLFSWKGFCFEAKVEGSFYRVTACLFACIDPALVKHKKSGVVICATLPKLTKDEKWARLLSDPKSIPRLKYELEYEIKNEFSDDDSGDDFYDMKDMSKAIERKSVLQPADYSSESSESDYDDAQSEDED